MMRGRRAGCNSELQGAVARNMHRPSQPLDNGLAHMPFSALCLLTIENVATFRGGTGQTTVVVRAVERSSAIPADPAPSRTTRITRHIEAPRSRVYATLLDPVAIAKWRVPDGMTCIVHEWDAREGGALRVSLTYEDRRSSGKSSATSDTHQGHFRRLVQDREIVEAIEFETADPSMRGVMTTTIRLEDSGDGTELHALHEGLPPGISSVDNEIGWRMALDKLAALVACR